MKTLPSWLPLVPNGTTSLITFASNHRPKLFIQAWKSKACKKAFVVSCKKRNMHCLPCPIREQEKYLSFALLINHVPWTTLFIYTWKITWPLLKFSNIVADTENEAGMCNFQGLMLTPSQHTSVGGQVEVMQQQQTLLQFNFAWVSSAGNPKWCCAYKATLYLWSKFIYGNRNY